MKKLLLVFAVLLSVSTQAQSDSTKVKALQLPAKLVYFLLPQIMQPSNDSLFQVAIDLRPKLRIPTPPTGNTLVTLDSIPTVELANLYNYTLNTPSYTSIGTLMQNQIANARAANTYLDALCLAFENYYASKMKDQVQQGKKMVTGKAQ